MKRSTTILAGTILIIYFTLFTSGLVFEITKASVSTDLPFSIALSNERLDIVSAATQNDIECMQWLNENWDGSSPVLSDWQAFHIIESYVPRYIAFSQNRRTGYLSSMTGKDTVFINSKVYHKYYLFLSSWNNSHGKYVEAKSPYQRTTYDLPDIPPDIMLIHQCRNSRIYVKEIP